MEFVFRDARAFRAQPPGAGEILVRPRSADLAERLDLAQLVLERGVDVLHQGAGQPTRLVLPANPTFDDMLAASFAGALLAGQPIPPGAARFARYAAMAREGLRPCDLPGEASIEGIFMAVRESAGLDLTQPAPAATFAEGWARLSGAIFRAAAADVDPFKSGFLAEDDTFVRERTFLRQDRGVYRQDVLRGQRWRVAIPGGPPHAEALVLRKPRSLMFKYWSRCRDDAPDAAGGGGPYLLLAVDLSARQWVFSTDPLQRLSLKSLAEQLQAAEVAADPAGAAADPWYDGSRHHYTLVAAPRSSTRLSEERVLHIARAWAHATVSGGAWWAPTWLRYAAAAVVVIGCTAGLIGYHAKHRGPLVVAGGGGGDDPTNAVTGPKDRGFRSTPDERDRGFPASGVAPRKGKDHAVLFATTHYAAWPELNNPARDVAALKDVLDRSYGFDCEVHANASYEQIVETLEKLARAHYEPDEQLLIFFAGHGQRRNKFQPGFIIPTDAGGPEDRGQTHWLAHAVLRDYLSRIDCAHILVMLDVCHGGTFAPDLRGGGQEDDRADLARMVRHKLKLNTRMYMSAGGDVPVSDGVDHSPFMNGLLQALRAGDEGVVTLFDLFGAVHKLPTEPQQGVFEPDKNQAGSDFLFISRRLSESVPATQPTAGGSGGGV